MYLLEKSVAPDDMYQITKQVIAIGLCKPWGTSRRSRSDDNKPFEVPDTTSFKLIDGIYLNKNAHLWTE
jgi:hypothetical protein